MRKTLEFQGLQWRMYEAYRIVRVYRRGKTTPLQQKFAERKKREAYFWMREVKWLRREERNAG